MDVPVNITVTKTDGTKVTQTIRVPGDNVPFRIAGALSQIGIAGMIEQKSKDKFTLLPASQIAFAEAEVSSIALVDATEMPPVPGGPRP